MKITKEMLIMDALNLDNGLIPVMQQHGLHCFGCPSSRGKSLEMAAENHGVDIDKLIGDMNGYLENLNA
jgi:hybrid cluster-associated redox disulfide protein